jgi:hypothetical protein
MIERATRIFATFSKVIPRNISVSKCKHIKSLLNSFFLYKYLPNVFLETFAVKERKNYLKVYLGNDLLC